MRDLGRASLEREAFEARGICRPFILDPDRANPLWMCEDFL